MNDLNVSPQAESFSNYANLTPGFDAMNSIFDAVQGALVRRRILFLTGTRADFGKLKPLASTIRESREFEYAFFATGMHMLARYGSTVNEIRKAGFDNVFPYINQDGGITSQMDLVLANTIHGLGHYVREFPPDLIVVHGDRVEALAGAAVGALNNLLVAHIEGGELSGTVDELLRHSISKLAHLHFVSNEDAAARLRQMGEHPNSIHVIGSPDIDVMLADTLPSLEQVRSRYDIQFEDYGIFMYHPVTTEIQALPVHAEEVIRGIRDSGMNFVIIYPNNDAGSELIMERLRPLESEPQFRLLSSMRFEYFLSLLKHARCIVGNSSAGIREAPVYGVPTVNVGSRQANRFHHESIIDLCEDGARLSATLRQLPKRLPKSLHFGSGNSAQLFYEVLCQPETWATPRQKQFLDTKYGAQFA